MLAGKIGDSIDELKALFNKLIELDYPIDGLSDHTISQSIYLRDPDGNEVELYVDNPDYNWRSDDGWMEAPVKPLNPGELECLQIWVFTRLSGLIR